MEEFTKDRSNSLLRAYENPIITTKLFYQKGHDILPRNVCSGNGKDLILMVVITSSPANFAQRQAVRSTWATIAQRNDTDAAFLIGQSENHRVNQSITKESEIYGDIIRVTSVQVKVYRVKFKRFYLY